MQEPSARHLDQTNPAHSGGVSDYARADPGAWSEIAPVMQIPEGATAEEKEAYWYKHIYRGDRVPQLTLRAVLMGGLLGMLMSISNLYTTLQVGWAFGVTITACVLSFTIWNGLRFLSGGRLSPMSILENNCMQSTASAAGYSTGATLGTACGALLLITGNHVPWQALIPFIFFTGAMGTFIAIPMKRQMINVEHLPFPTGTASAETLRSLYSRGREALQKAYALLGAMAAGGLLGFFRFQEGLLKWVDTIHHHSFRVPEVIAIPTRWTSLPRGEMAGLGLEPSGLLIGAGMLVGPRVALSMLASAMLLYFGLSPWLAAHNTDWAGAPNFEMKPDGSFSPRSWGLWAGTSLMVFASMTALAFQWRTIARAFATLKGARNQSQAADIARIEVPGRWLAIGLIPLGIGMVWAQWFAFRISVPLGIVALLFSFLIALVCCRATGETDTTPVGPMGKVTQLIFALLAPGNVPTNLMSAGATSGAGMTAADLLTDLKSGYLLGANPRKQFVAQFVGVFFGTLAVVPAWYLMVPDQEALEKFALPATLQWKAMAVALTKGLDSIPMTAQWAVVWAGLFGVLLQTASSLFPKQAKYMPSSIGLGLGLVMPFFNPLSFAIGGVLARLWVALHKRSGQVFATPIAAGLIAGESMVLAILAILAALPKAMATMFGS